MGSTQSVPQRLYTAVKNGDVTEVQAVLQALRRSSSGEQQRQQLLAWMEPTTGMTCLMLAASKNMTEMMRLLLAAGADPHVMSAKGRGTALHEAVATNHEAAVELLLHHRADPFLENAWGDTAMDLAVVAGNVGMVRRLERCALFCGLVNQKVLQYRGLTSANKDRWVVVMPRFLPPKPGQAVGVVRMVLWVYRDASAIEPRTKVWLDGASAFKVGLEDGIVRLHPNHEQPKNASTKYDRGWLMFFRPAQAAANPTVAREQFSRFIDCCNRPLDYLAAANAAAAAGTAQGLGASTQPAWPPQQQAQPPPPPQQQQQQPAAAVQFLQGAGWVGGVPPPAAAAAGGPPGAAYPSIPLYDPNSTLQQPVLAGSALGAASLPLRPADAPPPSGLATPPAASTPTGSVTGGALFGPGGPHGGRTSSSQGSGGAGGHAPSTPGGSQLPPAEYDPLVARPGESDADFAARLSRMYGSFSVAVGGGACDAGAQQQQQQQATAPSVASANPFLPAGGAAAILGPAALLSADRPSAPPAASSGAAAGAGAAAAVAAGGGEDADEEDLCIICLTNTRQIGFLHGSSVHRCVCSECAALVRIAEPCPLCRAPITAILNVY